MLLAMGFSELEAIGGLRMTVGRSTTEQDIEHAVKVLVNSVDKLRKLSAVL